MVGRQSNGDDVKAVVFKRQVLGKTLDSLDIGKTPLCRPLQRVGKHGWSQVERHNSAHEGGEGQRNIPCTRRDIEQLIGCLGRNQFHEAVQGFFVRVPGAGSVGGGDGSKVSGDEIVDGGFFGHAFSVPASIQLLQDPLEDLSELPPLIWTPDGDSNTSIKRRRAWLSNEHAKVQKSLQNSIRPRL